MDRLQEKHNLYVQLGVLFGPLQRLVANPNEYDDQERAETIARYFAECGILQNQFRVFSLGQTGHNYQVEFYKFNNALGSVAHSLMAGRDLAEVVLKEMESAMEAIDAVPVPRTSVILEAGSPFTAYRRLRELCEVDATKSITWLDPYFHANIFLRYVNNVRAEVPVTLVTAEPGPRAGTENRNRWNEFLDVSRLYAHEKGPSLYRLFVASSLHDRWVVFDDKRIYALGGSVKDAGHKDYFSIASIAASPENLQKIEQSLSMGTEYFGPTATTHL